MAKRAKLGRGVFYTRDSGGRAETTPGQYVEWAQRQAKDRGVRFLGTPDQISAMIVGGEYSRGDLFLDYEVAGDELKRPGLEALLNAIASDKTITHVFIPRQDRLARPAMAIEGVSLENSLRQQGITLVFQLTELPPLKRGRQVDAAEQLSSFLAYDASRKEMVALALKIIYAQIQLAKMGRSIGGRARYGFRRWLVRDDGVLVRELQDGEHVRMQGHHVVWCPGPADEINIIMRIIEMLESGMPASRVAKVLTQEGVPSPDHGRERTDHGVRHPVSGNWHQSTVKSVATNELLVGQMVSGRRSMGKIMRLSPDGPRELEDADFQANGQGKVIENPPDKRISAEAIFEPLISLERFQKLQVELERRAGSQKGKPRARDNDQNPLGGRIYDMNCSFPMHREPYNNSFRYKCSRYTQSHGAICASNWVKGPEAAAFVLGSIQELILHPQIRAKVVEALETRASDCEGAAQIHRVVDQKESALATVRTKLETVERNMAYAESQEQFDVVARVQVELSSQIEQIESELAELRTRVADVNPSAAIESAVVMLDRLPELAQSPDNMAAIGELFKATNAFLFLSFEPGKWGKRTVQRVSGGVLTLGDVPPPIEPYQGPTGRKEVKGSGAPAALGPRRSRRGKKKTPAPAKSRKRRKADSIGNVGRGERI